jgi:hypothetical protein
MNNTFNLATNNAANHIIMADDVLCAIMRMEARLIRNLSYDTTTRNRNLTQSLLWEMSMLRNSLGYPIRTRTNQLAQEVELLMPQIKR